MKNGINDLFFLIWRRREVKVSCDVVADVCDWAVVTSSFSSFADEASGK